MLRHLLLLVLASTVLGTHFRGGTLSWSRPDADSRVVEFRVIMHFFTGGIFPRKRDVRVNFGDGTSYSPPSSVLDGTVDASGTIRTVIYTVSHTYSSSGGPRYLAYIQSVARQSAITNGPNRLYRVEAGVDFGSPSCLGNPAGIIPGVVYLPISPAASFSISPSTINAQAINYSWFGSSGLDLNPPESPTERKAVAQALSPSFYGVAINWNTSSCEEGSLYAVSVRADIDGEAHCHAVWDVTVQLELADIPTCTAGSGAETVYSSVPMTRTFSASGSGLSASVVGNLPPGAVWSPSLPAQTGEVTLSWASPVEGTYAFSVEFCSQQGYCGQCSYSLIVNDALPQVDVLVEGEATVTTSVGIGADYTYNVTVENTSLNVETVKLTSIESSLHGDLTAYGCATDVDIVVGTPYECIYQDTLNSADPNVISVEVTAPSELVGINSIAGDSAVVTVVPTTQEPPTTTTAPPTTTPAPTTPPPPTTSTTTAPGATTPATTTTVATTTTTAAPTTAPPRGPCGAAGGNPCSSDADCGSGDAIRPGLCFNGFCVCGVGFQGVLTDLDPRACEPVCTPDPVPDNVAFLNEPNMTASAEAGDMVLRVSLDPHAKQLPASISMQNPVTEEYCNVLPEKLGLCELTQSVDGTSCFTTYEWRHEFYDVVMNSGCFVELPQSTETGPGFTIYSRSFETVFEVKLRGFGPFGQQIGDPLAAPTSETNLTRTMRRRYTFTVATRMEMASDEFSLAADGRIQYRLVGIDTNPTNNEVEITVQTRVASGGRVSPVRLNKAQTVDLAAPLHNVLQGPCFGTDHCDQFHTMRFALTPCAVDGSLVLNVGLECDEPAVGVDPVQCGFANIPPGNVYTLDNLNVRYDSCPISTEYGIDSGASYVRLYADVQRSRVQFGPAFYGSTLYGRTYIQASANTNIETATLASLQLVRRQAPSDQYLGDMLAPGSPVTLLSPTTSTARTNGLWNFELALEESWFSEAAQYLLEATVDLVLENTGALVRKRILIDPGAHMLAMRGAAERPVDPIELQESGIFSQVFSAQPPERMESSEVVGAGPQASATPSAVEESGSSTNIAAIAGAAVGALACVVAAVLIGLLVVRRRRKTESSLADAPLDA